MLGNRNMLITHLLRIQRKREHWADVGFTMLEMIIVVAIVGVISVMAAASYNASEKYRKVTLAVQKIQSDLRYAQNLALSFEKHQGATPGGGYGIRFTSGSVSYILFADINRYPSSGFVTAQSGGADYVQAPPASFTIDEWVGGTVYLVGGECAGNRALITGNTPNRIKINPASWHDGCRADNTTQFALFGNGNYDGAAEKVEDLAIEQGITLTVTPVGPGNVLDIVFAPPKPEVKVNGSISQTATITLQKGGVLRQVIVSPRGLIEIQ